jgi:hypothetical protein
MAELAVAGPGSKLDLGGKSGLDEHIFLALQLHGR